MIVEVSLCRITVVFEVKDWNHKNYFFKLEEYIDKRKIWRDAELTEN